MTTTRAEPPGLRTAGDRGQATVEVAMALPVVAVAVLALAQVAVSVRNEIVVELAAREAARAASVAADSAGAADDAAHRATTLPVVVTTRRTTDSVTVSVVHTDPTDVAIIGRFIGPIEHRAEVTMALEPP